MQISIIGGGPIGLIARTALEHEGHEVRQFDPSIEKPKMSLALAESSLALLHRIDVQLDAGEDLTEILVNEQGLPGSILLRASECGYPRFGRVICSLALEEALTQHKADRIEPLSVSQVRARTTRENPSVKLASGEMIHSDLVILADGGRSGLTESLGLTAQRRSFYRSAIMGRIRVDTPKAGRAYERFIGTGPLAILPIESSTYGFVWSLDPAYAEQLNQSPETLIGALQQAVPPEFGGIELGLDPVVIPLVERWVDQPYRPGVVLIGNGAQTIHPVAGQGLNLALRGLNLLVDALRTQDADEAVKTAFSQWRMNRDATRLASSGLEALFDRELLPRKLFTSLGMAFGDQSLWLKRKIAEAGMGVIS